MPELYFGMAVADGNIVRRGNEAVKSARSSFSSHVSLAATAFVCLVSTFILQHSHSISRLYISTLVNAMARVSQIHGNMERNLSQPPHTSAHITMTTPQICSAQFTTRTKVAPTLQCKTAEAI